MNKLVLLAIAILAGAALFASINALTEWGKPGSYGMNQIQNQVGYPILLVAGVTVLGFVYNKL